VVLQKKRQDRGHSVDCGVRRTRLFSVFRRFFYINTAKQTAFFIYIPPHISGVNVMQKSFSVHI
jgi:hypothetical protein